MTTANKGLQQPIANSPNWNVPLDANFGVIDAALGGTVTKSVTGVGSTPVVLTLSEYQNLAVKFTGVLSTNVTYRIPSGVGGQWIMSNGTTGSYSLTIGNAAGGSSVSIPQGSRGTLYSDGSSIYFANDPIPLGSIIMWSGSIASIPSGWALCDGTSGTPDLRNRFIVGAGSTYAVGDTGGANSVTLTVNDIPSHTHTFSGTTSTASITGQVGADIKSANSAGSSSTGVFSGTKVANTDDVGGSGGSMNDISMNASHSHTFSGTTAAAGTGGSHENRPPYYALAYIMKV